jgi:hypothetical protein
MGGGVNEVFLDRLQALFGPGETPRVKAKDPMVGHNMTYCIGCPCDVCKIRAVCLAECPRFKRWTDTGTFRSRRGRRARQ